MGGVWHHAGCCCAGCPTDCTACGNKTITITGFADPCCSWANTSFVMTRNGCTWWAFYIDGQYNSIQASLSCDPGTKKWKLNLSLCPLIQGCAMTAWAGEIPAKACPEGTYALSRTAGLSCGADSPQAVIA